MAKQAREVTTLVTARARHIRMSPYKVREVAVLIKGKPIDEARRILAFTPKAASREIAKVLESAIANAEHNFQIPHDELKIKIASADEGMTIKRFRPRAQGRGFRIRKRTCHINLVLERSAELAEKAAESKRTRRGAKATTAKKTGAQTAPSETKAKRGAGKASKASKVSEATVVEDETPVAEAAPEPVDATDAETTKVEASAPGQEEATSQVDEVPSEAPADDEGAK